MSILHNKYYIVLSFFLVIFNGCSNIDVGFEENSIFHSSKQQKEFKNAIVNVYLDTSTNDKNKFRLIINGEDTEVNLYYNVITRFSVNQQNTRIDLLKNNKKVSSIFLKLTENKNHYFVVENDEYSHYPVIKKTLSQAIDKNVKATPIFVSDEIDKQTSKVIKETSRIEKQSSAVKKKTTKIDTQQRKTVAIPMGKTEEKRYQDGETIFYYDANDGE